MKRIALLFCFLFTHNCFGQSASKELFVDGNKRQTLDAAIARLPAKIDDDVVIRVTGNVRGPENSLELNRPMRLGKRVRIIGKDATLNWTAPDAPLITVTQGRWSLENLQIGSRQKDQREGVLVTGPASLELHSVRIHTASGNSPGIHCTRGGLVELFGDIELNEDLHDKIPEGETFCGIVAEYFGVVRFREREKASLSIGNGSLSAKYYGVIELGCATAKLTSWHEQANVIAVNNSGRVDLHSTKTTLAARNPRNTPIGLEDDGHVLAEGAPITIKGFDNSNGIVCQKDSGFYCNDVTFDGTFHSALLASSGSTLLVGVIGDLPGGDATTGARIILEKCTGKRIRPVNAMNGGVVIEPK